MGLALLAFLAIFLLLGSAGLLFLTRGGMAQRLSTVVSPRAEGEGWRSKFKLDRAGSSLVAAVQPFEKVLPKTVQEVSVAQKRLIKAGFREDGHVRILFGAKVVAPVALCLFAWATRLGDLSPFFAYALALGLGYLLPDFWLGRKIKSRQTNIRMALPDFLDLMVVCIEAGLSLDQSLMKAADELRMSHPALSDELGLIVLESRAGRPRTDCWKNFADRVDLDVVNALVTAMIQADRFGTSIAKTLRVYADTLRLQRRQQIEEMAAKLPVKLVFPLVLFIFPSLFVVALGPAIISISESFEKYFK